MEDFSKGSLAAQGYYMPAEWAPHSATWLSWPRREGISFPDFFDEVLPALSKLIGGLAGSETVRINVGSDEQTRELKGLLSEDILKKVEFFSIPTNEPWCRDHGPIFLKHRERENDLRVLDWDYNAWGGKYPPFDKDDRVPTEIAKRLGLPVSEPGIVMEGGSIDVNGEGTLLTTESCLLNPNRNPGLSKQEIEKHLRDNLGVRQILWLGDGIEGDDTDGHVDDLTRFVGRSTVVTVVESDPSDSNYHALKDNLARLKTMKLFDGTPLEIITLPMPAAVIQDDTRLPASYANFYIANTAILAPVFMDPNDAEAVATLQRLFPTRKVIPIGCRELVWGLGTFHCLTQQQPK